MTILVSPSILSADFCNLQRDCELMLSYGADWLHIDIMDGHFVPNLTIGPPVIQSLRSCLPASTHLDCHLMIENPELWVDRIAKSGASGITFHLEATTDAISLAQRIKSEKMVCGVAIKPSTPLSCLSDSLLAIVDMVLIMTVEPGFGGQKLLPACIGKVRALRHERMYTKLIQVDGGVDEGNVEELKEAGADVIVAGSSIFRSTDPKSVIAKLKCD